MAFTRRLYSTIEDILKDMKSELQKELTRQGHVNTANLLNSIDYELNIVANSFIGEVSLEDYGLIVNSGVKANRVPYNRGSGAKSSKYIDALVKYFTSKGFAPKRAKSLAFATATIQKREGIPTQSSFRFSRNGKRTGFINDAIKVQDDKIIELAEIAMENEVYATWDKIFNKAAA